MPNGGYRQPARPAPVSGPGALARRTDSGPTQKLRDMPDAQYGEAATFKDLQRAAPLAQSGGGPGGNAPPIPGVPFGAPTEFPDEPITAGAPIGDGVGPEALGLPTPQADDFAHLAQYLPVLQWRASQPDASPSFKNFVRRIKGAV